MKRGERRAIDPRWALGGLLLLTALVFARVAGAPYVQWDDNVMILENSFLRLPFGEALRAFLTTFYHGDYLPVTMLSFWFDVKLFGFAPGPAHIENIAWHLLNVFLLWCVLARWRLPAAGAFAVCVLFALHPVQVESVAWISERKGLVSGAFLLLAILSSLRADESKYRAGWIAAYATAYALSFLAKASGVLLPFVLILADRVFEARPWRRTLFKHAPVLLLAVAGSWGRVMAYRSSIPDLASVSLDAERLLSLPGQILAATGFYVGKLIFPASLSIIYPSYGGQDWGFEKLLGFGAIVLFAWLALRKRPALVFAALTVAFLLPVLQIVPRINFVNDRYLYLPLIGVGGLLAANRAQFAREERLLRAFWPIAGLALVLGALSFTRAEVWTSDALLWRDTVAKFPLSGLARNNLAQALQREGDVMGALAEYERTLEYGRRDGTDNLAYNNLANLLSSTEHPKLMDLPRAERLLQEGIQLSRRPEDSYSLHFNLALLYVQMNDGPRALAQLRLLEAMLLPSQNARYAFLLPRVRTLLEQVQAATKKR